MHSNPSESRPVLHLTYHRVTPTAMSYSYSISKDLFREHLAAIQNGIGPSSYLPAVTFDDGNRTQFENAVPILAEYGINAIFFVTAGWTGVNKGSMDAHELRELAAAGHTVGAHGLTHKLLTQCSDAELQQELSVSKRKLEDATGIPVTTISMPGGRYDQRVLAACAAAGYTRIYTSDPTIDVREEYGSLVIGRYNVLHSMSAAGLVRLLDPSSGVLRREQRTANAKRFVRKWVGDSLYHRLWSVLARAKPSQKRSTT